MKKQYYIILDTETANSIEQPLPYDFGWVVIDRQGNIYEKFSYVIAEIYCGERDLMKTFTPLLICPGLAESSELSGKEGKQI